jgi:hypothetical protein
VLQIVSASVTHIGELTARMKLSRVRNSLVPNVLKDSTEFSSPAQTVTGTNGIDNHRLEFAN